MAFFEQIKALLFVGSTAVANGNPVPVSDAGGALTVDGTVAITSADLTSVKTAVEALDNAVDGNYLNTNMNLAGTDVSTTNPVPVSNVGGEPSASFTRPNDGTAYAVGDVVGPASANLTFANVSPITAGRFLVLGWNLRIDSNAIPAGLGAFRLHLFNAAPTAIADNAAFNLISADRAKYLGWIAIDVPQDLGDTLWIQADNVNFEGKLASASTTIYGVLQALSAFTPVAQSVFTLTLKTAGV